MRGNRFAKKRSLDIFILRDVIAPIATVVLILFALNYGLDALSRRTDAERLESTRDAVTRAAVQCYALEGRYPMRLSYLEESYGLQLDHDRYIIHYQAFASNILPDIDVLPMDFGMSDSDEGEDIEMGDWGE